MFEFAATMGEGLKRKFFFLVLAFGSAIRKKIGICLASIEFIINNVIGMNPDSAVETRTSLPTHKKA